MFKLIIITLVVIILLILFSNFIPLPLNGGTSEFGEKVIEQLEKIQHQRGENNVDFDSSELTAVIVEPREKNLVETIKHYMSVLPVSTKFQVYHGSKNKDIILNNFEREILTGKLDLWDMGVENLNIQSYSYILTNKVFWETIKGERVLIFQTDSITCGKSKISIDEFYAYSFIGAPLPWRVCLLINILYHMRGLPINHMRFFNGGLSYRLKSAMLNVIDSYKWDHLTPEDVWFCSLLPSLGYRLPDKETARKFGFEAEVIGNSIPWGIHKPRKSFDTLKNICPEVKNIETIPENTDYRNLFFV